MKETPQILITDYATTIYSFLSERERSIIISHIDKQRRRQVFKFNLKAFLAGNANKDLITFLEHRFATSLGNGGLENLTRELNALTPRVEIKDLYNALFNQKNIKPSLVLLGFLMVLKMFNTDDSVEYERLKILLNFMTVHLKGAHVAAVCLDIISLATDDTSAMQEFVNSFSSEIDNVKSYNIGNLLSLWLQIVHDDKKEGLILRIRERGSRTSSTFLKKIAYIISSISSNAERLKFIDFLLKQEHLVLNSSQYFYSELIEAINHMIHTPAKDDEKLEIYEKTQDIINTLVSTLDAKNILCVIPILEEIIFKLKKVYPEALYHNNRWKDVLTKQLGLWLGVNGNKGINNKDSYSTIIGFLAKTAPEILNIDDETTIKIAYKFLFSPDENEKLCKAIESCFVEVKKGGALTISNHIHISEIIKNLVSNLKNHKAKEKAFDRFYISLLYNKQIQKKWQFETFLKIVFIFRKDQPRYRIVENLLRNKLPSNIYQKKCDKNDWRGIILDEYINCLFTNNQEEIKAESVQSIMPKIQELLCDHSCHDKIIHRLLLLRKKFKNNDQRMYMIQEIFDKIASINGNSKLLIEQSVENEIRHNLSSEILFHEDSTDDKLEPREVVCNSLESFKEALLSIVLSIKEDPLHDKAAYTQLQKDISGFIEQCREDDKVECIKKIISILSVIDNCKIDRKFTRKILFSFINPQGSDYPILKYTKISEETFTGLILLLCSTNNISISREFINHELKINRRMTFFSHNHNLQNDMDNIGKAIIARKKAFRRSSPSWFGRNAGHYESENTNNPVRDVDQENNPEISMSIYENP